MRDYTINGNVVHRRFMSLCEWMHWKPSRWLPKFPAPKGIFIGSITYRKDGPKEKGTMPFFDGYHFLFTVAEVYQRPLLTRFFGQLFEIRCGIYDWIDPASWIRANSPNAPKLGGDLTFARPDQEER